MLACLEPPSTGRGGRADPSSPKTIAHLAFHQWKSRFRIQNSALSGQMPPLEPPEPEPTIGQQRKDHPTPVIDHRSEASHPSSTLPSPSRVSRRTPSNHTRTCNKLPDVYV